MIAVSLWGSDACDATLRRRSGSTAATEADIADMNEQEFRVFYSHTASPLKAYLVNACGNTTLADDLLQEAFYRLLRSRLRAKDEHHRRNYLYKIATNLLRDHYRRRRPELAEFPELPDDDRVDRVQLRSDVGQALRELKPRDRIMLWLAYVEGFSHSEIGEVLGLRTASLRPMLFRARQRLADTLRARGLQS